MGLHVGEAMKKKKTKRCDCKGQISKCDHSKHPGQTSFGDVRDLSGKVVYRHADPSWQCSGCGMPLEAVK
jgi:hypothetical protein